MRALQRRVFPGGDGRYFEPEITGQPQTSTTVSQPSTTAVTDILARLDAMDFGSSVAYGKNCARSGSTLSKSGFNA